MDIEAESVHRNKTNLEPATADIKILTRNASVRKSYRFRAMIRKHRRSIAEMAAELPPDPLVTPPPTYEQVLDMKIAVRTSAAVREDITNRTKSFSRRASQFRRRKTIVGAVRNGWRHVYNGLGLRHWAFISVIICYSFIGGIVFSWLERENLETNNAKRTLQLISDRAELIRNIFEITGSTETNSSLDRLDMLLRNYQRENGLFPKDHPHWDIWDGVFFSYTVFTTIGYGHFVPATRWGRLATIIYALIGIPLLLAVLADFGKLLTRILKRIYSVSRHVVVTLWKLRKLKKMKATGQQFITGFNETDEDIAQFDFPIPLALFMIVAWLFICAFVFRLWETNWTYFDAFYFFFISLSTIGLGDLVPDHPKFMIASFPFILIGLTLVSLVVNLIQIKIDELKEKAQGILEDQLTNLLETESASECDPESIVLPDEIIINTEPHPSSSIPTVAAGDRFALGVLQTMKLRAKRRRIGTQTDESYIRSIMNASFHEDPLTSSVYSTSAVHWDLHAQIIPGAPKHAKRPINDDSSASSSNVTYYDTSEILELE